ncbi:MAG: glycosyltransferase family 2 protein [Candidatus Competibacteraceae bacterium]|nr:glycosyltransferase family 2 protein [Candidatus Competibacteraceae bacterium]
MKGLGRWFHRPILSVVVVFYDMRREAERTLYSLTPAYQRGVSAWEYEVIAVDNGSRHPLDPTEVRRFGPQFRHQFYPTDSPSPCVALNAMVKSARGRHVMCCIDGARILSPGILRRTLDILSLFAHPFVYTLGMHLGRELQNQALLNGYNQRVEDELLNTVDWRSNGYQLFRVACLAASSRHGPFGPMTESNCFAMLKADYLALGGYDERFQAAGGGYCNPDFFNRIHETAQFQPVRLLGEATFHQFHGGAATNVPPDQHPGPIMAKEYRAIRDQDFRPVYREPVYWGECPGEFRSLLG